MPPSRRDLLATAAAGGLLSVAGVAQAAPQARRRVLRIAHMTDAHVQPERNAAKLFERALETVQARKPDVIIMGGDQVMDATMVDEARAKVQWDLFKTVVRANVGTSVKYVLGNHDVWGWGDVNKYKDESLFGKLMAMERLELDRSYYAFERNGWRIVVLDSIHRKVAGPGFVAKLDDSQWEWLKDVLEDNPRKIPTLVVSHVPLVSAAAYMFGTNDAGGTYRVSGALMHSDFRRIKELFRKHDEVKAAISGHLHMVDRVTYSRVNFFCNGAVSGGWWRGPHQEFEAGYGLIDLYSDGMVFNRYETYEVSYAKS